MESKRFKDKGISVKKSPWLTDKEFEKKMKIYNRGVRRWERYENVLFDIIGLCATKNGKELKTAIRKRIRAVLSYYD